MAKVLFRGKHTAHGQSRSYHVTSSCWANFPPLSRNGISGQCVKLGQIYGNRRILTCPAGWVVPSRSDQQSARKLVVRRTSEHWWEDEQEFDALTEMVLPKRLHLAAAGAPPAGATAAAAWGPVRDAGVNAMLAAADGKFACGFSSTKLKAAADELWRRLRQDGPPYFRKVRTRASLDVLEDETSSPDAVSAAAEELWGELCGQTWRVELDYGLAGAEAEPRDELLLACSWQAARRFLAHAGIEPAEDDDSAARASGFVVVHVSGYSAAPGGQPAEDAEAPSYSGWRDLRPTLQPVAAATAAASASSAS